MDLSSYLIYAVTSLDLGDLTNDHTQLDRVTRVRICVVMVIIFAYPVSGYFQHS